MLIPRSRQGEASCSFLQLHAAFSRLSTIRRHLLVRASDLRSSDWAVTSLIPIAHKASLFSLSELQLAFEERSLGPRQNLQDLTCFLLAFSARPPCTDWSTYTTSRLSSACRLSQCSGRNDGLRCRAVFACMILS